MKGKRIGVLLWLAATAGLAFGQQVTRIAVVDLARVISACSQDSQSVKEFERKKSQVQTDIDKMSGELMRIMSLKADADKAGDKAASQKYREDIDRRTKSLQDFVSAKQAELDEDAKKLAVNDAFSQRLYKQIQNIAETEGYSLVLNLKSSDSVMNAVLWYSPMIDITSSVIQALGGGTQ
jgi:outer membrane protein